MHAHKHMQNAGFITLISTWCQWSAQNAESSVTPPYVPTLTLLRTVNRRLRQCQCTRCSSPQVPRSQSAIMRSVLGCWKSELRISWVSKFFFSFFSSITMLTCYSLLTCSFIINLKLSCCIRTSSTEWWTMTGQPDSSGFTTANGLPLHLSQLGQNRGGASRPFGQGLIFSGGLKFWC